MDKARTTAPPHPKRRQRALLAMALAGAALAGNYFSLPLSFGIDFLFGSIAVLLAVAWLGTGPGVAAALVGGAYTWLLWDHPNGLILFTAEAAAVGWHRSRARASGQVPPPLAVSVTLYWLLIGIPFSLLAHRFGVGMDWTPTLLVAAKQALNGILNAALAGLVLVAAAILTRRQSALPLAQVLFGVLLAGMLIPALLVNAWANRDLQGRMDMAQADRLAAFGELAAHHLAAHPGPGAASPERLAAELGGLRQVLIERLTPDSDPQVRLEPGPIRTPEAPPSAPWDLGNRPRPGEIVATAAPGLYLILPSRPMRSRVALWRQSRYRMEIPTPELAEVLPGAAWHLTIELQAAPSIDQVQAMVARVLAALLAVALLGVALADFLSRRLVTPLHQLVKTASALPSAIREDRPWPAALPGLLAETGQLASAVTEMAKSLAASFHALREEQGERETLIASLSQQEARYRLVVENLDDLIVRVDVQGRFEFVSPSYCRTFGRSESQLLGQTYMPLVHPDDQAATALAVESLFRPPHTCTVEQRAETVRGWRWLQWADQAVLDGRGEVIGIVGVGRDITERKAAERALKESEERFRNLFETMGEGVVYRSADGVILDANPAALNLLGRPLDAVKGLGLPDLFWRLLREDGSPLPAEEHPAMVALRTGQDPGETVLGVFLPATGETRWILVHARPELRPGDSQPHRVFTTFSDITRLKRTEQRLAAIIEGSPHGIVEADPVSRRLLWCNGAMQRLFGYSAAEVEQSSVEDLHPSESLPLVRAEFARMARADLAPALDLPCRRRDGTVFYCKVSPGLARLGQQSTLVAFFTDVTQEHLARRALEHSEAALLKAQEIAKLGSWELDIVAAELSWSPEAFRIFERDPEHFVPCYADLLNAIHPEDRPTVERAYWDSLAQRAPYDLVHRLLLPDGRIKWVHDRCESEFAADGRPLRSRGTVQDITARKLAELAVVEREAMLSELLALATRFVNVSDQGIDDLTKQALARIGRFIRVDRGFVCRLEAAADAPANRIEWVAEDAPPMARRGQIIPPAELPALMARLRAGESVAIARMEELPADWAGERERFAREEIRSVLAVPLALGDTLQGLVGFDTIRRTRDWSPVEIYFIQVFANVLAGALDRARATADLRASNARYDQLARQSRTIAWETDARGRYTYLSPVCEDVLGYSARDLIGTSWLELLDPGEHGPLEEAVLTAAGLKAPFSDIVGPRQARDGRTVWLLASGAPILATDGRLLGYRGMDIDITERHLAQERLMESEAQLASVFDNAPIGMALVGPDLRLRRVNRAMAALLGRSVEELGTMRIDAITHPDDLGQDLALFAELNAGRRTSYRMTKRYLRPDGSVVWGDLRTSLLPTRPGEPPIPLGMVEDVTELHAATQRQQALEETLSRYTAQLEEMVDLANLSLAPTDQIRALLRLGCQGLGMAEAVLGVLEEEEHRVLVALRDGDPQGVTPQPGDALLGPVLAHRQSPRVLGPDRLPSAAVAAGLRSCIAMAFDRPRPDGQSETLILSLWGSEPSPDLGTTERQIVRLIAQRIASVRLQEQTQDDLVAAKERETIGHLASGVAHDFNNLLGVIDANLYYLDASLADLGAEDPEIRQVLEETQSALGQAKVITSGMLSLSRAGGVPLARVDLGPPVAELERILRQILPPDIALQVAVPPGLAAWTNSAFLQSALLNLALNARDAMAGGGVLSIQAETVALDAQVAPLAVGRLPSMDCVDLSVIDTGSGIAPDQLARIFDPLFSTKAKQRGHGLGLFMVQEFVVRSGAGLAVESALKVGTRFRLLLPREAPAAAQGESGSATALPGLSGSVAGAIPTPSAIATNGTGPAPLSGLRVLVVDDDPRVREAVARLLALDGASLALADQGEAGLQLLEREGPFDLVLSDIAMPVQDGIQLLRHLALERPDLPVILMTGQESALGGLEDIEKRPLVLRKPIDPPTLRAAILMTLA